jgi:hypothetical protein
MHRSFRYLDQIFGKDTSVLGEWIEEIKGDIYARQYLAADVLRDLRDQSILAERELDKVSHWHPGYNPSADKRRSDLERQLEHVRGQQREQKLSLWQDIGMLRKELRVLVREYRKAKRKQDLMQAGEGL